jgi:uncharacterized membrane protein YedE/YeeE
MEIVLVSVAFLVAAVGAGIMGYAIQRGATCTVAAVDEAVTQRTFVRLLSLLEAAALGRRRARGRGRAARAAANARAGYAVSLWTVVGGVLLGLGAYINGACVFDAIARFGSGGPTSSHRSGSISAASRSGCSACRCRSHSTTHR